MSELLAAFGEFSVVITYYFVSEKFWEDHRMPQMDWMIAFIVQIAVSVCWLTVYGRVNGFIFVNFINTSKKGNAVEASYVKVILGCVLLEL